MEIHVHIYIYIYLFIYYTHICRKSFHVQSLRLQIYAGSIYMGIFGSGSPKRHRLFSNDKALVERLCEKAGYMSRADQSNCTTKLTTKYIDKSGKSRCVGVKTALKESAYLVSCFWQKTVILDFFGSPSFWVLDCDLIDSTSEIGFCETLLW